MSSIKMYVSFLSTSEGSSSIYFFGILRCGTRTDITSWRSITAALFVLIFFHQKAGLFMIFRRLELPHRKLMESLSLTRNAEIVGSLFLDIKVTNSSSDDILVKIADINYMFLRITGLSLCCKANVPCYSSSLRFVHSLKILLTEL